jgi:hypothetical protein
MVNLYLSTWLGWETSKLVKHTSRFLWRYFQRPINCEGFEHNQWFNPLTDTKHECSDFESRTGRMAQVVEHLPSKFKPQTYPHPKKPILHSHFESWWNCGRWGLVGGSGSLVACFEGYIFTLSPPLLLSTSWPSLGEQLSSAMPWLHDVLPHYNSETTKPADHRLKPLKPCTQINLSSFKLFLSGICHNNKSLTHSIWITLHRPCLLVLTTTIWSMSCYITIIRRENKAHRS